MTFYVADRNGGLVPAKFLTDQNGNYIVDPNARNITAYDGDGEITDFNPNSGQVLRCS